MITKQLISVADVIASDSVDTEPTSNEPFQPSVLPPIREDHEFLLPWPLAK